MRCHAARTRHRPGMGEMLDHVHLQAPPKRPDQMGVMEDAFSGEDPHITTTTAVDPALYHPEVLNTDAEAKYQGYNFPAVGEQALQNAFGHYAENDQQFAIPPPKAVDVGETIETGHSVFEILEQIGHGFGSSVPFVMPEEFMHLSPTGGSAAEEA